jgi:hypothetical protein
MVPLPTFAKLGHGDIGLQFAMRVAPLGIIMALGDILPPHYFFNHDITHASRYANQEGLAPIGRFLAEQGAFMKALPAFMQRLDDEDPFYEQVHEKAHDPLKTVPSPVRGWERYAQILQEELARVQGGDADPAALEQGDDVGRRARAESSSGLVDRVAESSEASVRAELP